MKANLFNKIHFYILNLELKYIKKKKKDLLSSFFNGLNNYSRNIYQDIKKLSIKEKKILEKLTYINK